MSFSMAGSRLWIYIKNEKGIALVTALILALVSMAIATATIYMVLQSTSLSGTEKRYTSALAAAKGAARTATKVIAFKGVDPTGKVTVNNLNCFEDKLENRKRDENNTDQWVSCSADEENSDPTVSPDMVLSLGDYTVYLKIIDTVEGNTRLGENIRVGGVVSPYSESRQVAVPRGYTIAIKTINNNDPSDTAEVFALYAY